MRANGKFVGVQFQDGEQETDLNVPVEHVRGFKTRDFTMLALLQRQWEKPIRQATERARVRRQYVPPTQPEWKPSISKNGSDGPEQHAHQVITRTPCFSSHTPYNP